MKSSIKILFFVLCLAAFVYQAVKCFGAYFAQDIGTSISFIHNREDKEKVSFALCYSPASIFDDDYNSKSSVYAMSLRPEDIPKLTIYGNLSERGITYRELVNKHLKDPLSGFTEPRVYLENGAFIELDPLKLGTLYHSNYGLCRKFDLKPNITKHQGIRRVTLKIRNPFYCDTSNVVIINGTIVGPVCSDTSVVDLNLIEMNSVVVFVYQNNQFHFSQKGVFVTPKKHLKLTLAQTIIDKTKVADMRQISCEESSSYSEDDCLEQCLRERFFNIAHCVHAKIKKSLADMVQDVPDCGFAEMRALSENETFMDSLSVEDKYLIEEEGFDPGLMLINRIINGFSDRQNVHVTRCSCPEPCRRKILKYQHWNTEFAETSDFMDLDIIFEPYVIFFDSYLTYTSINLFGEVGGYLGLMLGHSIYSLIQSIDSFVAIWRSTKRKLWGDKCSDQNQDEIENT